MRAYGLVQRVGAMLTLFLRGAAPIAAVTRMQPLETERYAELFRRLLRDGIYVAPSQYECLFPSLAHGDEEIDATIAAVAAAVALSAFSSARGGDSAGWPGQGVEIPSRWPPAASAIVRDACDVGLDLRVVHLPVCEHGPGRIVLLGRIDRIGGETVGEERRMSLLGLCLVVEVEEEGDRARFGHVRSLEIEPCGARSPWQHRCQRPHGGS